MLLFVSILAKWFPIETYFNQIRQWFYLGKTSNSTILDQSFIRMLLDSLILYLRNNVIVWPWQYLLNKELIIGQP
jgi:hypothetical protein